MSKPPWIRLCFGLALLTAPAAFAKKAAALDAPPAVVFYPAPAGHARPAPAFKVVDSAGHKWALSDTQSKPVLIDFWATWCRPCLDAMPDLNNFYKLHSGRIGVLGLNIDIQGWSVAKPMGQRYNLAYPIAVTDPKLSKDFGAKGYPYLALVYQGKIVKTLTGAHHVKDLEKELAPWLK